MVLSPFIALALDTVVVTATRVGRPPSQVPASIDVIAGEVIRDGRLQVNLSETLPSLAGVVANNRQNYAQDLQVSIRGFGARSTFGVRGLRIVVDDIPATLPDGQSQVSHVDLGSAGRIEVLRGPFSVLHGNSSGGVIQVFTGMPEAPLEAGVTLASGSDATRRMALAGGVAREGFRGLASASHFETGGYRDHSRATRTVANAKGEWRISSGTEVTIVANALDMPDTQDPLGLSRAQFERDPRGVDPVALQFNTRKSVDQAQGGLTVRHPLSDSLSLRLSAYGGRRGTEQFQAIPTAPQANPLHPGGVIDLARDYGGVDLRLAWDCDGASLVGGLNADRLRESRRGFQNFAGAQLGVLGALRRDERNRVTETGAFVQGEWPVTPGVRLLAGARASRVAVRTEDRYVVGTNPDDSGALAFDAVTPVAGATWQVAPRLAAYAAFGRGFETPTVNELAYRPGGLTGLNAGLRAAESDNGEVGLKWRDPDGWRATAAVFRIATTDEIVVLANSGGRTVFRNAGATRREGVELQASRSWPNGVSTALAYSHLRADYRDGFAAGNRIPGVPRQTFFGELRWRGPVLEGGVEVRHAGTVAVNDLNSDAVPAHTVAHFHVGATWRQGGLTFRPYLRLENAFGRHYAGSVIVNEGNGRFFEPAPGRTWLAGVQATWGKTSP